MMTMRVNGLLRKRQHPVKRARLMMSMRANGLLRKSGTLPWHAPVARSRGTLPPRARARPQAPPAPKPEIVMENTFTNGLRLKT